MAYNKASEERKWNYWKEQEEKKLRELGMEEEKRFKSCVRWTGKIFWKNADTGSDWMEQCRIWIQKDRRMMNSLPWMSRNS